MREDGTDDSRWQDPAATAAGTLRPGDAVEGADEAEPAVSALPGDGALSRAAAKRGETTRRWGVVTPSATRIGRADSPEADLSESVRRLHEERHRLLSGHSTRMHRLDKARLTQAVCNALDVTPWQRDRAIGLVLELDLTAFGSQRAVPTVALVAVKHVVDRERRRRLGLHDQEYLSALPPADLEALYDRFDSIADEPGYRALMEAQGLTKTNVNRLGRVLREQVEERDLEGAVYGRNPHRDPDLPELAHRAEDAGDGAPGGAGPDADLT